MRVEARVATVVENEGATHFQADPSLIQFARLLGRLTARRTLSAAGPVENAQSQSEVREHR